MEAAEEAGAGDVEGAGEGDAGGAEGGEFVVGEVADTAGGEDGGFMLWTDVVVEEVVVEGAEDLGRAFDFCGGVAEAGGVVG